MEDKKYNYIYKITCIVNDTFYIGMHSTDNLNDNYYGSGKRLKNSIKKYGIDNHIIDILEFLPNRTLLAKREKELVNEDLLADKKCMNLVLGGDGGYNIKAVESNKLRRGKTWEEIMHSQDTVDYMKKIALENYKNNIEKYNFKNLDKDELKTLSKKGNKARTESGYTHSDKTKAKIKESNKNKDWSERKSEAYRKMISDKTKEAMEKLDRVKIQQKAQEGRKKYWKEKHKVLDANIVEMIDNGLTPAEISNKLDISTRTYYNRLKIINSRLNKVDK